VRGANIPSPTQKSFPSGDLKGAKWKDCEQAQQSWRMADPERTESEGRQPDDYSSLKTLWRRMCEAYFSRTIPSPTQSEIVVAHLFLEDLVEILRF